MNTNGTSTAIRNGLLAALALASWSLVVSLFGWDNPVSNPSIKWISMLVQTILMGVAIFKTVLHSRSQNDHRISFKKAFKGGFLTTLVFSVLMALFTYLYMQYVDTGYFDQLLEVTREQMEEKGLDDDEIDMAMDFTKAMMTPTALAVFSFLSALFVGFVLSLLVAFNLRTRASNHA